MRMSLKFVSVAILVAMFSVLIGAFAPMFVATAQAADDRSPVMKAFQGDAPAVSQAETDKVQKSQHKVLFLMGTALLILILATASFGVAMALFGKEVFVAHMITAGATVFLAVAHAVTAMVWFYPF